MENYRRASKAAVDSREDEDHEAPNPNEIRMSQGGKISNYVTRGLEMLNTENCNSIVIVGKGVTINKAVTVVEIIKRRKEGSLHQYTQLGNVTTVEKWDNIKEADQESILVNKRIPMIVIHLSSQEIPDLAATSGYQAPTGPETVPV